MDRGTFLTNSLDLPNSHRDMTEFIAAHPMDNSALMLADADFIREAFDDYFGWAELVDALISQCYGRPAMSLILNLL